MSRRKKTPTDIPFQVPPFGPPGTGLGPDAEWRRHLADFSRLPVEADIFDTELFSWDVAADIFRWMFWGPAATQLGYWTDCRFAVCRRQRACRAERLTVDAVGEHWALRLPCCFQDDDKHQRIMAYLRVCAEGLPDDPDDSPAQRGEAARDAGRQG